jgi:hypothetical protein
MALDFPASPTDGQVYQNWIYSTDKGAWKAKPLTPAKTLTSDTPPGSPSNGDQWFNTIDGTLYIYVTDVDGSQWVESRAPITADGYTSPNYIINGGFDIWQRGTSFTGGYTSDRWYNYSGSATTTRETTIVPDSSFYYSLKIVSAGGAPIYAQMIETLNAKQLAGKTVTLSVYVYGTGNQTFSARLDNSSVVDDTAMFASWNAGTSSSVTLNGGWERISVTQLVPTSTKSLRVRLSGEAAAGTYYIAGVQLESGSVATTFRRNANSIQGELDACQRYYWRQSADKLYTPFGIGITSSSTGISSVVESPATMRVVPTAFDWSGTASHFQLDRPGIAGHINNITPTYNANSSSTSNFQITFGSTGMSAGQVGRIVSNNNLNAYLGFSAEL